MILNNGGIIFYNCYELGDKTLLNWLSNCCAFFSPWEVRETLLHKWMKYKKWLNHLLLFPGRKHTNVRNAKTCKISTTKSCSARLLDLVFLSFFFWSLLMSHNQWEKISASNALPLWNLLCLTMEWLSVLLHPNRLILSGVIQYYFF